MIDPRSVDVAGVNARVRVLFAAGCWRRCYWGWCWNGNGIKLGAEMERTSDKHERKGLVLVRVATGAQAHVRETESSGHLLSVMHKRRIAA